MNTSHTLFVGAAARPITPDLAEAAVFLAGFQRDRRATGVEADLWVRALALRQGDGSCVLVVCDLIGLGYTDVLEARHLFAAHGGDPQSLVVICTHTHSGPDMIGLWGPDMQTSGVNRAYRAHVLQTIAATAADALAQVRPAHLRCATTRLPDLIANFRDPELVDDGVTALQALADDGSVIATLLNLACHPEVLSGESTLLSPDYAGAACRAVEAQVGGVALHISGALGGMLSPNTAPGTPLEDRTPLAVETMGRAYARVALDALATAPMLDVHMQFRRAQVRWPIQNPLLEGALATGLVQAIPPQNGMLTTEVAFLDLGGLQVLTVPGEPLPKLGFALKALLPGPFRMIAALAEDELGYILPDEDFTPPADYFDPGAQYEESMSIGPQTGSLLLAAAMTLVQRRG